MIESSWPWGPAVGTWAMAPRMAYQRRSSGRVFLEVAAARAADGRARQQRYDVLHLFRVVFSLPFSCAPAALNIPVIDASWAADRVANALEPHKGILAHPATPRPTSPRRQPAIMLAIFGRSRR